MVHLQLLPEFFACNLWNDVYIRFACASPSSHRDVFMHSV
jgi:hypothetical protein